MKSRILIFSIAYDPLIGGAELAVRNITDRLFDYEFDMVTVRFSKSHKPFEKIGNVNVYRVGFGSRIGRMLFPFFAFNRARKLHASKNYQIVWSIMAAYAGAAALHFKRKFPVVKYLLTLQEGDSIEHIHSRVRGFRLLWQKAFQKADYIQAISKFLADWAKTEDAVCPIEVVPNGVDVEKFSAERSSDFSGKVITTSRLVPKNGVDILIRAVAMLNVKLQILGSGPEDIKLKNLTRDLNIGDRVDFLGDVENTQLPAYLAKADIFVRPSRSEGLGNSFLEAMAANLPVIGTPVGGIPDFLIDGETGLFCKPEDPKDLASKIQTLVDNGSLRNKLAENGRKLVEQKYDWKIIAGQMSSIFQKLILNPK